MQKNKKVRKLWNQFKHSGLIEDYLMYSQEKRKQTNNEENSKK